MKVSSSTGILVVAITSSILGCGTGFTVVPANGAATSWGTSISSNLSMSSSTATTAEEKKTTMASVRKSIQSLTNENFSSTLKELEPYLLNEAGTTMYTKSIRRIATRANLLGMEVPTDYAKQAKATKARRAKQDAFIQTKEEERLAAEAEAAEAAAAAEAEAASDEEATTEEGDTAEEEAPVEEAAPELVTA